MADDIDVEVLEARVRWLEQQLAATAGELARAKARRAAKVAKGQQPTLLDVEPTKPPDSEERTAYAYWCKKRRATLEAVHAFVEDEKLNPAFINTTFKRCLELCGGDHERMANVIAAYFKEQWPTKYTPPYPLKVFASAKVQLDLLRAAA